MVNGAKLPDFVGDMQFRHECAERARAYIYRVRARRARAFQARMIALAVFTTVATALFVSWQLVAVVTWLLNN